MSFSWVCPTVGTVSSVLCSVYVEILHEALPWALELLFLDLVVFLMDQSIWAQYGPPPQPYIWAVPGALIPTGSDVSIFCRTPPGVTTVRLYHYEPYGRWFDHTPEGAQEVFEFSLQRMTHENVGVYYCEYRKGGEWSQKSDLLNLVMTVSSASNYILDNRVRHIMAIFIVLTLGVLLLDAWKSRREPMGPLQSPKMRT
ncbi:leukocyte-associated immunoglobulin-like receptor 2 isoform X7 [Mesocricetus auratus]|uniref:Leukocyte-associated immunoglobulin-like receptor 2 isoform X7 n=1 Tax=Mesocricetus auratus TaxID=10036 RepID=A0ABM2WGI5_MESAU|nr:leukocyte-associated immunoglobulin-like receptor 2 isoform X7 [Mesocricetus auratus]